MNAGDEADPVRREQRDRERDAYRLGGRGRV